MFETLPPDMGSFPGVTSVLVERAGHLELEWYRERDGADLLRNTRSATKTVTGMLVGIAVQLGLIHDVHDALDTYLDGHSAIGQVEPPKVTIEDLLTMSSCLDCDDADSDTPGNEERMYPAADWLTFARSIPVRHPCGPRRFRYCTAHTVLLGAAVEAASGMELSRYADEYLLRPIGITKRSWFRSDSGMAFPGGGLELRSRDLLALGTLLLSAGRWEGRQVLSSQWVASSTASHVTIDGQTSYGYLLWLHPYDTHGGNVQAWLMLGNGGNKVAVIPELDAVVVITATNYGMPGMHELTDQLLRERVLSELGEE